MTQPNVADETTDHIHGVSLTALQLFVRLKNADHQRDLVQAIVNFLLASGGAQFIGAVKEVATKHNRERDDAKLAHLFLTVANQHMKLASQITRELQNLMDVLDTPEHRR